ncbi:hypothetical protein [Bradyrhizobium sp.]|uniref:hypothetical protein n=1 Tax=Bradyrhizobium sp. TaxID=376 RepID=UPI0025BE5372|nr:hypothetical protein [Bradyrhizobium sp.]
MMTQFEPGRIREAASMLRYVLIAVLAGVVSGCASDRAALYSQSQTPHRHHATQVAVKTANPVIILGSAY